MQFVMFVICQIKVAWCTVHIVQSVMESVFIYNLEQMEVFKTMMMCLNSGNQLTEPD